jgi:hypothetical protein
VDHQDQEDWEGEEEEATEPICTRLSAAAGDFGDGFGATTGTLSTTTTITAASTITEDGHSHRRDDEHDRRLDQLWVKLFKKGSFKWEKKLKYLNFYFKMWAKINIS